MNNYTFLLSFCCCHLRGRDALPLDVALGQVLSAPAIGAERELIDRGGLERDGPLDGGDATEGDGAGLRTRDDASTVEAISARDVGMEENDPELRPG